MPKLLNNLKIKALESELSDLDSKYKRALADYQNLEKRHSQEKLNFSRYANETLLRKLLNVLDDLERAQNHLHDLGLDLVITQFIRQLESEGVSILPSTGKPFDPVSMDCAEVVAGEENQVVRTIAKGYLYHEKVLRPAKVEVGGGVSLGNKRGQTLDPKSEASPVNNIN